MTSEQSKNKFRKNYQKVHHVAAIVNSKIYCFNLLAELDNNILLDKIYKFRENNPQSMHEYNSKGTNVKAWHSDYLTNQQTDILKDLIRVQNIKIVKIFEDATISIKSMWINMYTIEDSAKRHKHSVNGNGWSTLYYPYVESNPTPVIFDNNDKSKLRTLPIVPETGMFLFFPSTLYHRVPTITESKRISIASNLDIVESVKVLNRLELEEYEND